MKLQKKFNNLNIYGIRPIIEAIESDKSISKIFLLKKGIKPNDNPELRSKLISLAKIKNIPLSYIPKEKFRKDKNAHQGAYCILSPIIFSDLEELINDSYKNSQNPIILILDEIKDIKNLGAIIRSASCFNVSGIVIPTFNAAQINSDVIKTSSGALFHLPICRVKNIYNTLKFLKDRGLYVVALSEKTNNFINARNFNRPLAVLLGSEDKGIKPQHLKLSNEIMKIPISGPIESLNVSIAASIICYEINKIAIKN